MSIEQIHLRALAAAASYRKAEAELIGVLQDAEVQQVYIHRGHSSLFQYVVTELGLGENTAYSLITVARKAREVPELREDIASGRITLSNARRVSSVLTQGNQIEWLGKARELSARRLDREIARVRPQASTPERASYINGDRVRLELGLSERAMLKLRRAQDLLSQSRRRPVSLEETLESMTEEFVRRRDPVERAKRHQVRRGPNEPSESVGKLVTNRASTQNPPVRHPLRASVRHRVHFRDGGRCTYILSSGLRCNRSRWIDIHHKHPVSQGGTNAPENLTTLCSAHHRLVHVKA